MNLFDKDNANTLNAIINGTTKQIAKFDTCRSIYISCDNNEDYTISRKAGTRFVVGTTTNIPVLNATCNQIVQNNTADSITIKTTENDNYLVVFYYNSGTDTLTEEEIRNSIKIEKGSAATPWSPYEMGSVGINIANKNLLYYTNENQTIKGIDYTINQDKSIKVKGTATEYSDFYLRGTANQYEDIGLVGTFKLSGCNSGSSSKYMLYVVKKDKFGNLEYYQNIKYDTTFTISKGDTLRIFIRVLTGVTVDDVIYPMLRVSTDIDRSYTEAKKQTAIMPIQQEMLEGDYVADVEHHEWGKLVLTGNENFVQAQNANKLNYFYLSSNLVKIKGKIISNMLKNIESGIIWNKTSYDDIVSSASNSKTINIMLSDTTITTLQQFKEKLKELYNAGTPIIIYYELAEPIDLELTSEQKALRNQKLYTYKNITNISLSDELASIDVTYKKDLETMFNNIIKQIPNSTSDTTET